MTHSTKAVIERWLTRKQAAQLLGVGERRILALAQEGAIRSKRERDEDTHQIVVKLDAQSLKDYSDRQKNGDDGRESRSLQPVPAKNGSGALMRELLASLQPAAPTETAKPWLAPDEAAKFSGLTEAYIGRLIESGELPARNIVKGTNAKAPVWRVRKQDLENLAGEVAHV